MPASGKKAKAGSKKGGATKKAATKRSKGGRELLDTPRGGKRYVRRKSDGEFAENQDSVSRSLRQDVKQRAKKTVPPGQGDRGDQKRRPAAKKRSTRSS